MGTQNVWEKERREVGSGHSTVGHCVVSIWAVAETWPKVAFDKVLARTNKSTGHSLCWAHLDLIQQQPKAEHKALLDQALAESLSSLQLAQVIAAKKKENPSTGVEPSREALMKELAGQAQSFATAVGKASHGFLDRLTDEDLQGFAPGEIAALERLKEVVFQSRQVVQAWDDDIEEKLKICRTKPKVPAPIVAPTPADPPSSGDEE